MGVSVPGTSTLHYKYFWQWILKVYFLDLLLISLIRTLFNIHTGENSCSDGA